MSAGRKESAQNLDLDVHFANLNPAHQYLNLQLKCVSCEQNGYNVICHACAYKHSLSLHHITSGMNVQRISRVRISALFEKYLSSDSFKASAIKRSKIIKTAMIFFLKLRQPDLTMLICARIRGRKRCNNGRMLSSIIQLL